jgi:hypothetical protein
MSMRQILINLGLGIQLLFMSGGCTKVPANLITEALRSTNVVFEPNVQPPITLSDAQARTIKRIVERFREPSQVRAEKDILPHKSGGFVLGSVHFGWLGRMLYVRDPKGGRYYVVEDVALSRMSEAFFKAQGPQPPIKYPTQEEWQQILTALEKAN